MRKLAVMMLLSATFVPGLSHADPPRHDPMRDDPSHVRTERLVGGNENPPVISEGSGSLRTWFRHDQIAFRLRYDVASMDSDITQSHLHIGNPGNNGGIVVFLCTNLGNTPMGATARTCPPSPGFVTGRITAEDVLEVTDGVAPDPTVIIEAGDLDGLKMLIRQGAVYANVHTNDHGSGEIRGQMSPRPR
jgi:CHRD domain